MQQPIALTADQFDERLSHFFAETDYTASDNMRWFAAAFCRHFRFRRIPRDPFVILPEVFGIELRRVILPEPTRAQWIRLPRRNLYVIEYSEHRTPQTLSLSLWHELAEIIFAHPDFPERITSNIECRLATGFAVNITMPEVAVRRIAAEYGHPKQDKTYTLAARFGVSKTAMRIRLEEFGLAHRNGHRDRRISTTQMERRCGRIDSTRD